MIYLNGDGFAAASYANCEFSYASQDTNYALRGKLIHPNNINCSFGKLLSLALHQPLSIEAWQFNVADKIFREVYKASENKLSYVIITWPNLLRDEVFLDGHYYTFAFKDIEQLGYDDDVQAAIFEKMKSADMTILKDQFEYNLIELCRYLDSKRIKHLMIPSDSKLPMGNANWLWEDQTIVSWASKNNYLNSFGFLNKIGHQNLFKLVLDRLTNQ